MRPRRRENDAAKDTIVSHRRKLALTEEATRSCEETPLAEPSSFIRKVSNYEGPKLKYWSFGQLSGSSPTVIKFPL